MGNVQRNIHGNFAMKRWRMKMVIRSIDDDNLLREKSTKSSVFKYLFKYVYKGGDRTTAVLQNEVNEIQDYVDARYLSAPEAVWHIFGFKLHHRFPAIQRLQIHLPNQQTVTFDNNT